METKKKTRPAFILLLGAGIVAVVGIAVGSADTAPKQSIAPKAQTPEEKQATDDLAKTITFAKLLKDNMKDPESFKLHQLGVTDKGAGCIEYSGTNSYGGRMRNSAVISRDAKAMLTSNEGNKFVAAWNKHCAKQQITDQLSVALTVMPSLK